jgi:hypothetical protein
MATPTAEMASKLARVAQIRCLIVNVFIPFTAPKRDTLRLWKVDLSCIGGRWGQLECFNSPFLLLFSRQISKIEAVTVETFRPEIDDALKAYDKFIVCIDKTPERAEESLKSLMEKALKAYQNRGPNLRHGIALDKQITIILSQTETDRPLCGIYFNLSSPYHKRPLPKEAESN